MACLRRFFYVATPTEMIFDRAFPLVTVKFFIGALVRAGSYSALKLEGVYGALAGQLGAAGVGGMVYAWFVSRYPARRWWLVVPGVVGVWLLFTGSALAATPDQLPWAPARAGGRDFLVGNARVVRRVRVVADGLLPSADRPRPLAKGAPAPSSPAGLTRRRFLAGGFGALAAVALGGLLRQLYKLGTFDYDGTQYAGPQVQTDHPQR